MALVAREAERAEYYNYNISESGRLLLLLTDSVESLPIEQATHRPCVTFESVYCVVFTFVVIYVVVQPSVDQSAATPHCHPTAFIYVQILFFGM